MTFNPEAARKNLHEFDFKRLFINNLGWDRMETTLDIEVDETVYHFTPVAQKYGFAVFQMDSGEDGILPGYPIRRKIEAEVRKSFHEHILIFIDRARTIQKWQWVRRETGKPLAIREYEVNRVRDGRDLISRLDSLYVSLAEEETQTYGILHMAGRVKAGFDVERVTRSFYDEFKKEHDVLAKFLKDIPDESMQRWYASVTLNRLMFVYFIQKNYHLNSDVNYLKNRLAESPKGKDRFYKDFVCPLFFEGFAKPDNERDPQLNAMLGNPPYLNGGIFARHIIEQLHGEVIQIPDEAFNRLFDFFDRYQWHLDDRPLRQGNEINPDVLGYIFEKYINQKEMGAYYTKEDITGYISKSTILPYLLDETRRKCAIAFEGDESVWKLLQANPRRYIFDSVQKGVDLSLPADIAAGIHDVSQRVGWNKPAQEEYALPTEIWREVVARRQRFEELEARLKAGEITEVNDLITWNLDIQQFTQDLIEGIEGPDLLRAFWKALENIKVLDPTCGSGAFLFAALNNLEPLYEACLQRMGIFVDELEESGEKHSPVKFSDFKATLEKVEKHPNQRYFIYKSIIIHNLYGVDIMEEAVEICRLRLFLKLVSQAESGKKLEALPDIDFNIQAGNTLVGYTSMEEIEKDLLYDEKGQMVDFFSQTELKKYLESIKENGELAGKAYEKFQQLQDLDENRELPSLKLELEKRLESLKSELDKAMSRSYGINADTLEFQQWTKTYKPLHWYIAFFKVIHNSGFNVVIGNPPYVEYKNVIKEYRIKNFQTLDCNDLYAFTFERSLKLSSNLSRIGLIIPVSSVSTEGFNSLRRFISNSTDISWISSYAERPSKLFTGVEKRLSIWITHKNKPNNKEWFVTNYRRWLADEREFLFQQITYSGIQIKDANLENSIPKLSSSLENSILGKINLQKPIIQFFTKNSTNKVFYTRKLRYFVQFFDFVPRIVNEKEEILLPSELKELNFYNSDNAYVTLSVLNSNLFFWFISVFSDIRNLNRREINLFRLSIDEIEDTRKKLLIGLSSELMYSFKNNSRMITNNYGKFGILRIQSFSPRLSKTIIDGIDNVISEHYGFTQEEKDFIINYDIKYRLGVDSEEE